MASSLDSISREAPALWQAQRISERAVEAGFEWDSVDDVWAKVNEEIGEFLEAEPGTLHKSEELGDVLFTLVNVARKEGIDAERALLDACSKFRLRWGMMERHAQDHMGRTVDELEREELETLWGMAKEELAK